MASLEELIEERKDKLAVIQEAGRDPYPSASTRTHRITEVLNEFKPLAQEETTVCIAGRIMAIREHGGSVFVDVDDGSDEIQLYIKKDILADDAFDLFVNAIDRGDFVEFTGTLFETNRGEKSVEVQSWRILAKSLRPLPEKWHGIQDAEKRFRRRYLDMLLNTEVKERIRRRACFFHAIRSFLQEKDFIEVQTPVIETTPGGADARPFETHHNALDLDVYLRISAGELWQKQLMVGGFEKVFELGRIFRNEGMSPEHLQDYMQMEFYWAYADYEDGMRLVKELFRYVAQETYDTQTFSINGFDVDLAGDWERYDYVETVKDMADIDVLDADTETILAALDTYNISYDNDSITRPRAIDSLWKYCRKQIGGPGFLVHVPKALSPLSKSKAGNKKITERFQPIIAGSELGNGYSELNNPIDQKKRFAKQATLREEGDKEAQMYNDEFVEALEYGMPPTCGFGMSERVFAFLEGVNVREAQIFPLMRPKN